MRDPHDSSGPRPRWWLSMLADVQFWIPLFVLVVGLLLLSWVA